MWLWAVRDLKYHLLVDSEVVRWGPFARPLINAMEELCPVQLHSAVLSLKYIIHSLATAINYVLLLFSAWRGARVTLYAHISIPH
jgi:hypothetical protein